MLQPTVRLAAVQALTAWEEQIGIAPFIEDETLTSALAKEKPFLKMEVTVLHASCSSQIASNIHVIIRYNINEIYFMGTL